MITGLVLGFVLGAAAMLIFAMYQKTKFAKLLKESQEEIDRLRNKA